MIKNEIDDDLDTYFTNNINNNKSVHSNVINTNNINMQTQNNNTNNTTALHSNVINTNNNINSHSNVDANN